MKRGVFLIFVSSLLGSCQYFNQWFGKEEEMALASVGNEKLYLKDLQDLLVNMESPQDSIQLQQKLVDDWVRKQVIVQKALEFINPEDFDIEKRVREYRESLVIHWYEEALISQKIDSVAPIPQLRKIYEDQPDNFILSDDIFRIQYIIIPVDAPKQDSLVQMISQRKSAEIKRLQELCFSLSSDFDLQAEFLVPYYEIITKIPTSSLQLKQIATQPGAGKFADERYIYIVNVLEFHEAGQIAPFAYVKKDLEKIFFYQRKQEILRQAFEDMYQEAVKKGQIEIY